jgi:hypothetical protein
MAWSSAIDTCGRILLATGGWLKKWWKWIVGGLAIVGAFLIGLVLRPKTPIEDPVEAVRRKAEEDAQKKEDEIQRVAAEREKEVVVHAEEERKNVVDDVKKDTAKVQDDLQKTNDYLHDVGDEMRKP